MLKALPRYQQAANTLLRPDQITAQTTYFHTRWLPRLGAQRAMLVITLRRLVHQTEAAASRSQDLAPSYELHLTSKELARQLGLTAKQVQRLLKSRPLTEHAPWRELDPQEDRTYKQYEIAQIQALQHFIPRLKYDYQPHPDTGRPERCGYVLELLMDEPLTPEDQQTLNSNFGVKTRRNAKIGVKTPQNWRLGGLKANFGAQPNGNLAVTGADTPGATVAAAAAFPPRSDHSLVSEPPLPAVPSRTASAESTAPAASSACSPRPAQAAPTTKTVELDLPLSTLRSLALRDLTRVHGRSARTAIVTQFAGRFIGLGRGPEGLLRSKPDREAGDYARVGELCRDFKPARVLKQLFAIAGRLTDDVQDPLAYLRSSLEYRHRPAAATTTANGDPLDQLTFADYRARATKKGGAA